MPTLLYCLASVPSAELTMRTYVGVTEDLKRRLRQHQGLIKGGARSTRVRSTWRPLYTIQGFPSRRVALQFEWRLHRRLTPSAVHCALNPFGVSVTGRRAWQLYQAMRMERVTAQAPPTASLSLHVSWFNAQLFRTATTSDSLSWPPGVTHTHA